MNNQIFWISSYPKSGNTLLRFILIALFFTDNGKFTFDRSKNITQFDSTTVIKRNEKLFGEDMNNLADLKVFYKYLLELQSKDRLGFKEDFIFLKTHSGLFEIDGNPFTSANNSRGIIYIVRDPRDVSISWSNHNGISLDESINFITNDYAYLDWPNIKNGTEILNKNLVPKSFLSSWDKHVISWTSLKWKTPLLVISYEDLVYNKEIIIKKIIRFFEKNYNFKFNNKETKIKNIIKTTDFNEFKKFEETDNFKERTKYGKFFSTGKKDQWKNQMNLNQINKVEKRFEKTMKMFNYKLSVEI
tara:strand:+ start:11137 stop:12042 length:906 start_codon:yes stop_codon:yes gene_type:complete